MKILLTGGYGFIGQEVHKAIQDKGDHEVTVFDSTEPQVHGGTFRIRRAGENCPPDNVDVVIHLGAKVGVGQSMYEMAEYVKCNTLDTAMFLERLTVNKPKRLVVASSMSIYGEGQTTLEPDPNDEDDDDYYPRPTRTHETFTLNPRSVYALTKYDQEMLCRLWGEANDVPVVALRFFNVYGPGQALRNGYTGVMSIFASRLLNGKPPIIFGDGTQSRDFINVKDVAEAVCHAALNDIPSGPYNVGTGIPRSIASVAYDLAHAMDIRIMPEITGRQRKGDIQHCFADISKIKATGWEPKVKWMDGLEEYVKWLKEQPVPEDTTPKIIAELENRGLLSR